MSNLRHFPEEMTYEQLRELLKNIHDGFIIGDTLEGSIEFIMKDDKTWNVTASYRVGNKNGQGGMMLIGNYEPD